MKVKELIEILSKFDPDIDVCIEYDGYNTVIEESHINLEDNDGEKIVVMY